MRSVKKFFQILRVLLIFPWATLRNDVFWRDLARWKMICKIESCDWISLAILLWEKPEFRNLLMYRYSHHRLYRLWISWIYRPMNTLFIEAGEIGGGLFIQHGFSTMIAAKSIGENCWINQQVTIGYNGTGEPPVIGNNVMITCGAKVLGTIHIGDGAVIGANAVVVKDVEPGAVMGGVPARKIK